MPWADGLFSRSSLRRVRPHSPSDIPLEPLAASSHRSARHGSASPRTPLCYEALFRPHLVMKFSHSLQFNSVPDWADRYVA
jgi:hypothetical protein